jgi:dTDP-glucose pyrophosphorylase
MKGEWEKTLIAQGCTIREALSIMDEVGLRIAIVVDENKKLLGVVSDGDVRRGLLAGISLNDNVSKVMITKPAIANTRFSNDQLFQMMKAKGIMAIPLVDDDQVVGLKSLHESLQKPQLKNPVFIMAGGFGTRLLPLTDNCPKPMLDVGDKPMLERILLQCINSGFSDFYISTHYLPDVIMDYFGDGSKWGVSVKYVHEDVPLGTGGALGLLPVDMSELPLLVINGDVLTNVNFSSLLDFHDKQSAGASICVREHKYRIPYGVVQGEAGRVISMEEKPTQLFYINAGIYVVNRKVVKQVKLNERVDMPSLLDRLVLKTGKLAMFPIHEYWLDIGRIADYERAQLDVLAFGLD